VGRPTPYIKGAPSDVIYFFSRPARAGSRKLVYKGVDGHGVHAHKETPNYVSSF